MESDAAVWIWIGRYLWAPMLAVFGAIIMVMLNSINKSIEEKAPTGEVFRELKRIEGMAKEALDGKIFDDYVARADAQRREDRLAVIAQFGEMKAYQSTIMDKIDRITALLLQSETGRRSGDIVGELTRK